MDKFKNIINKVKKTFEILRVLFTETPPEPGLTPRQLTGPVDADSELAGKQPAPLETPSLTDQIKPEVKAKKKVEKVQPSITREAGPGSASYQQYLEMILTDCESMNLAGFGSGGQALKVQFDKIYFPLQFMDKRLGVIHPERDDGPYGGAAALSLGSALQRYRRLHITGSAGSGKTTLLHFILLTYARSLRSERLAVTTASSERGSAKMTSSGKGRLIIAEDNHLPILISLRELGLYLKEKHSKSGIESPVRLLNFLKITSSDHGQTLPDNFFDSHIVTGKALLLMDGLDEIEDRQVCQRVLRLIEGFVNKYPSCRYIITSRVWDIECKPLLDAQFGTLEIRELISSEVRQFVRLVSSVVEVGVSGVETPEACSLAKQAAQKLMAAIEDSPDLANLAVTPLALTDLILVQRHREQVPEFRMGLYDAAIESLLDGRDEAVHSDQATYKETGQRSLDRYERRRALELLAFWLHQNNQAEIGIEEIKNNLKPWFLERYHGEEGAAQNALDVFLRFVDESSGLLFESRAGKRGFSERVYQEVLAAHALAEREDTLAFTSKCIPSAWWHEVLLFETGILNHTAKYRVSELVRFILDSELSPGQDPDSVRLLAAECLSDLDIKEIEPTILEDVRKSLKQVVNSPVPADHRQALAQKLKANHAMAILQRGQGSARFWAPPFGEPEWVKIPAGEFWMGAASAENQAAERVFLPAYQISRVPVTNAQYSLYLSDSGLEAPDHWRARTPPRGFENHPVVNVNWHEALAYCAWLASKINQPVSLPSEAEWEKAVRGVDDQREYPWGDWNEFNSNTSELGLGSTSPAGFFPGGASPYGVLDMTGNVREWTRSLADFGYPYDPSDKAREDLLAPDNLARVLRGGSYYYTGEYGRCSNRQRFYPDFRFYNFGFRVVISPGY